MKTAIVLGNPRSLTHEGSPKRMSAGVQTRRLSELTPKQHCQNLWFPLAFALPSCVREGPVGRYDRSARKQLDAQSLQRCGPALT